MKRLLGTGTGKHGQRDELTQKYGYDTKAAMHAVRLLGEGFELMETGAVTFPRPDAEKLIEIREGKWSLDRVCAEVSVGIRLLNTAAELSDLPKRPDRDKVSEIVTGAYLRTILCKTIKAKGDQ